MVALKEHSGAPLNIALNLLLLPQWPTLARLCYIGNSVVRLQQKVMLTHEQCIETWRQHRDLQQVTLLHEIKLEVLLLVCHPC